MILGRCPIHGICGVVHPVSPALVAGCQISDPPGKTTRCQRERSSHSESNRGGMAPSQSSSLGKLASLDPKPVVHPLIKESMAGPSSEAA